MLSRYRKTFSRPGSQDLMEISIRRNHFQAKEKEEMRKWKIKDIKFRSIILNGGNLFCELIGVALTLYLLGV